jgi:hypothetical protein
MKSTTSFNENIQCMAYECETGELTTWWRFLVRKLLVAGSIVVWQWHIWFSQTEAKLRTLFLRAHLVLLCWLGERSETPITNSTIRFGSKSIIVWSHSRGIIQSNTFQAECRLTEPVPVGQWSSILMLIALFDLPATKAILSTQVHTQKLK